MIEADHYENICELILLIEQTIVEKSTKKGMFWNNATKYASVSDDESFVEEVAYMMVTLHRTGA